MGFGNSFSQLQITSYHSPRRGILQSTKKLESIDRPLQRAIGKTSRKLVGRKAKKEMHALRKPERGAGRQEIYVSNAHNFRCRCFPIAYFLRCLQCSNFNTHWNSPANTRIRIYFWGPLCCHPPGLRPRPGELKSVWVGFQWAKRGRKSKPD